MRLDAPGVRIADAETCDFGLMPVYGTAELLHRALPDHGERYLHSPIARQLLAELGVQRRYLTSVPGEAPDPARLNAIDLGCSAVDRLRARRAAELERLDALIFVSTSNPNPCNSQAALLAERCGLRASCMDLKAGCSGGVLGLLQAALLIRSGCERVLVVMAENLSQLVSAADPRMLLTVGDGAACVLLERAPGPGFLAMLHGTEPALAGSMVMSTPFPPASCSGRYVYEFSRTVETIEFQKQRWRSLFRETIDAAGVCARELERVVVHQTHQGQVRDLVADLDLDPARVPSIVAQHGNMGTPTVAVALASVMARLLPGQRYLLEAVGGGVSWCAIVAEHA
ncbi:MAG TPA: 3-oxoacyl-[acyl-carrier-protein] synthase III C-terminal domain-containing protein [Longimicrobiales bacterium]|nr:3-oxoacyl-[acyl-carrier-protein] synthase III C-terminal domain-containing protein [Longimicrobiales bacterium]